MNKPKINYGNTITCCFCKKLIQYREKYLKYLNTSKYFHHNTNKCKKGFENKKLRKENN